ncbi:DUF6879 family protein [Streptomyces bottropensis]|uniref:DUF6879 family protein n=1 Tax=Streptomyces bottropensis TaxID=42235 RepID=UPI003675BDF6
MSPATPSPSPAWPRARIISVPVSDYIEFEHHLTGPNMRASEQVRWLPRRRTSALALPGNDFWLFDDGSVVFHHFAGDGELAPHDEEFSDDPAVIMLCADAFETVCAGGAACGLPARLNHNPRRPLRVSGSTTGPGPASA